MFYILHSNGRDVLEMATSLERITQARITELISQYGPLIITEQLYIVTLDGRPIVKEVRRVPAELGRAVDAWNAVATLPKIRNASRFITSYRRWKRENPARDFLLEKLVDDVIAQPFTHGWITFGWLFGKKNGETNSEKLRNGKFADSTNRRHDSPLGTPNGEFKPTER